LIVGGSLIELDNGWRLTTARIAGDPVMELVLNGVAANRDELLGYGLSEEIFHYKRRWFVVREDADDVLSRLLAQRKAIKDLPIVMKHNPIRLKQDKVSAITRQSPAQGETPRSPSLTHSPPVQAGESSLPVTVSEGWLGSPLLFQHIRNVVDEGRQFAQVTVEP